MNYIWFQKIHSLGNDFVVMNAEVLPGDLDRTQFSIKICDRHFGVGSDGLLVLEKSTKADCRMRMYNSLDGKEAHCGNGMRCLARFAVETGFVQSTEFTMETPRGVHELKIFKKDNEIINVSADMGQPILQRDEIPMKGEGGSPVIDEGIGIGGEVFKATCLSMGNPHAVIFCDDPSKINLKRIGPQIETHNLFPLKTNVEFIKVLSRNEIQMRVWERGGGITLACGSGACASTVASNLKGLVDSKVSVQLPGGVLEVEWEGQGNPVIAKAPAEVTFKGSWALE